MLNEILPEAFAVVKETARRFVENKFTYILPDHLIGIIWKGKFKGQKQKWFEKASLEDLKGGEPEENAVIIKKILDNSDKGKKADIVILNAGAGIFVGGKSKNLEDGVQLARESIESGAAFEKLNQLAAVK